MSLPANDLLSAFHDGEVNSADRAVIEQRLAASAEVRRELSEIRQVSSLLKELPRERLPSEFPQQVLQAIEREMLIPFQRDDDAGSRTRLAASSSGSSHRWVGVVAVLTSAAGLLLLVRATDFRSGSNSSQVLRENAGLQKPPAAVASSRDSSVGGEAAVLPMLADSPSADSRNSGALGGAAGGNSIAANSPLSAPRPADEVTSRESGVLFFDQSRLRDAQIGDLVRAMQTEGTQVAVVWLTVVDRQDGQAGLQLLLGKDRAALAEADKKSDRAEKPNAASDQLHAVFVEYDVGQLTATLKKLREDNFLQSLKVDQPIEMAQLNDVGSGFDSESTNRRFGVPAPFIAEKKIAKGDSAPKLAAKAEQSHAKESQDSKDQLATPFAFEVSRDALLQNQNQNQANQQTRNRGISRNMARSQSAVEKNAEQALADQRPMHVLFVVVDQTQAGKPPVSPNNLPKSATPATPSKGRTEPAKPADKDGAA